jgi:hypothetical protein
MKVRLLREKSLLNQSLKSLGSHQSISSYNNLKAIPNQENISATEPDIL